MPEHFTISLIIAKPGEFKNLMEYLSSPVSLNKAASLGFRDMKLFYAEDDKSDFEELVISFPEHFFRKENFTRDINQLSVLINGYFELNNRIHYALCSYELNGYLIGDNMLAQIEGILNKFPIAFAKREESEHPVLLLNLDVQNIFR